MAKRLGVFMNFLEGGPEMTARAAANVKVAIALTAGFGGISPNLLQIAIDLTGKKEVGYVNMGYFIGLLLLAIMGAGIALIWGEKDLKRAYYLGLGLPSLIQVALANATQKQVPPTTPTAQAVQVGVSENSSSFSLFATPAFAESPQSWERERTEILAQAVLPGRAPVQATTLNTPVKFQKDRQLALVLEDVPEGAELWFTSPDGQVVSRVILGESSKSDKGSRVDLKVPDFASSAFLRIENSKSGFMPLKTQEGSTTAFRVDVDHSRLGGFLKALGVQNASVLNFEIKSLRELSRP
jgi:hypothetical protein